MKKSITLLLLFLTLFLSNCSDDNKDDFFLTKENLSQTVWEGAYEVYQNQEYLYKSDVNLFFKSDKNLEFIVTHEEDETRHTVPYTLKDNLLTIETNSMSPQLSGDWLIQEQSKNKIVCIKNFGSKTYYYVMTLSRTY